MSYCPVCYSRGEIIFSGNLAMALRGGAAGSGGAESALDLDWFEGSPLHCVDAFPNVPVMC